MKRRIILILTILIVIGLLSGGIWWYLRSNSGWRLLARVQLAMRTEQFDKAAELAAEYTVKYPDDWQGYYWQARALARSGKYPEARQQLDRILGRPDRMQCDEVMVRLLLAETYAHPAKRSLSVPDAYRQIGSLQEAMQGLKQANDELTPVRTVEGKRRLDVLQAVATNLQEMAGVSRELARLHDDAARTALKVGDKDAYDARTKDSMADANDAQAYDLEAGKMLLQVVVQDAARELPAQMLVENCLRRKDEQSLAEANRAIMALADPPPVAAMMLILHDMDSAGVNQPANSRQAAQAACERLDQIIKKHPDNASVKLRRAELAIQLRDEKTAERLCGEVLAKDSRNPEARMLHARLLLVSGNVAEAERELFTLKTDVPGWPEAHFAYAQAALANGNKQLARDAMRTVTRIDPEHVGALMYLASSLKDEGFYDQAFEDARKCLEAAPDNPAAIKLFTDLAKRTDQPDLARQKLKQAAEKFKDRSEVIVAVAEGYAILGDNPQALAVVRNISTSQPGSPESMRAVARALMMAGQLAEAEKALLGQLSQSPATPQPEAHNVLGRVFSSAGRPAQAIEQFRMAVREDPKNATYQVDLARALLNHGELDECRAVLEDTAASDPTANLLRLELQVMRGQAADAAQVIQQVEAEGRSGLPMAIAYFRNGQPRQCIDVCLAEIKKTPPEERDLQALLAQAYLAVGERDKAIEQLKALVTSAPAELTGYLNLAAVFTRDATGMIQTDDDKLAGELGKVPQARAEMVELARGWLLDLLGKYEQAGSCYEKLAQRNDAPEDVRNRACLLGAQALARSGQADKALAALDTLVSKKEMSKIALLNKAQLLTAIQRLPEALDVLVRLRESAVKDGDAATIRRLVDQYSVMKKPDEALLLCDQLEKVLPTGSQALVLKARLLDGAGKPLEAVAAYEAAIGKDRSNVATYVELAAMLDDEQKLTEALQVMDRLSKLGETGQSMAMLDRGALLARYGLQAQAIACFEQLEKLGYSKSPRLQLALGRALFSVGQKERGVAILKAIPVYAQEYEEAQRSLAAMASGIDAQLQILADLDKAKPGLPGVLAERMNILMDADKPDDAIKCFKGYLDAQGKGRPLPIEPSYLALTAMLKTADVAAAEELAARVSAQTLHPRWRKYALLLTLDRAQQAAQSMLPEPSAADMYDALIGISLAASAGNQQAMANWTGRLAQIDQDLARINRSGSVTAVHRFLVALASGKGEQAEAELKPAGSLDAMTTLGAAELLASAKSNARSAQEAGELLRAVSALELGLPSLGARWAMQTLKSRPTCQMAALIATRGQSDVASRRKTLQAVQPADCQFVRLATASLLMQERQYEQAVKVLQEAGGTDQADPALMLEYGGAMEHTGKLQEALALYLKAWAAGKSPVAANNAAYLTSILESNDSVKLGGAQAMIEQAIAAAPNVAAFRETYGWICHLQGQKDKACEELRRAVKGLPDSPEAHYHTAMAESDSGNNELARYHLEAAVQLADKLKRDGKNSPETDRALAQAQNALKSHGQ
jgi:tetratricopeptide (TPR) repeat protein